MKHPVSCWTRYSDGSMEYHLYSKPRSFKNAINNLFKAVAQNLRSFRDTEIGQGYGAADAITERQEKINEIRY